MKFTCQKDIILKELSDSIDFSSSRNSTTMFACVCLILSEDNLTIKTTDQKTGYVSDISVSGLENGSTAVLCEKLLEIIKNLRDEDISFEVKDDKLEIKQSNVLFKLKTQDPSGFPMVEIPHSNEFFRVPQKDFTDMINQVGFAVSDDESKFAMTGAHLERCETSLIMVGTDGRRLSYINRALSSPVPDFGDVTIPSKFLSMIKKHSVGEGDFEVCVNAQSIYIKYGSSIIFSNLIKNEYPAYKRVIPESQTNSCIVNIKALDDALKRISLVVESKHKKIYLEINDNKLTISSDESELGNAKEELECKYNGPAVEFAMNYSYLMGPLKVMDGSEVKIAFSVVEKPFTITTEPERDYLHVIMPMNLK